MPQTNNVQDFIAFRRMLTPMVLQILQGIGLLACLLGFIGSVMDGQTAVGIATLVLGPVAVRLFLEGLAVVFSINETLTSIKNGQG